MLVHRSNRLEELVDRLDQVVRQPLSSVLEPQIILIQSAGMERFLSRELARRSGVAAGLKYPYPRGFFRTLLDETLGPEPAGELFEREHLTWALHQELRNTTDGAIRQHLQGDEGGVRRFLLAQRLAHLFDQYLTFRPRMVLSWEQSEDDQDVQAQLWRRLVRRFGSGVHFAARCARFLGELDWGASRARLPSRLCLVGGPGLPPLFLQMLVRLSEVTEVHVFSFTVCQEYFAEGHIVDDAPTALAFEDSAGETLPLTETHPLLASMGRVGADYQELLEIIGGYQDGPPAFRLPEGTTALAALQRSLVLGQLPPSVTGRSQAPSPPLEEASTDTPRAAASDASITLDVCHSRMREVEVLHDRLLEWFSTDATLRPEEVVVLAPNIEDYSPLIEAVFASRSGDSPAIPFRIADRSERRTNAAARALLLSLSLLRGRFRASEMLDLLQLDPVRARVGIGTAAQLAQIGQWVHQGGIRNAVDATHRRELGLVETDLNTWVFGLRRLLLGFAMPDDGQLLYDGTVPFDDVVPSDAELLGRFVDFCEHLFRLRQRLVHAEPEGLSAREWTPFLFDLLDGLAAADPEGRWDVEGVRALIGTFGDRWTRILEARGGAERQGSQSSEELCWGLSTMQAALESELDEARPSTDFLTGGVTFCALLPLRTIPFRRICVLGLGQGDFPRLDTESPLNLMRRSPKRGDRSLRDDDRYLFLELLHSARERLALSYVGRSIQDNTEEPGSVVLEELDAALRRLNPACRLEARMHPLQPFSPRYFRDSGLLSFDDASYEAALALTSLERQPEPLFSGPLSRRIDEGPVTELGLSELVRFFKNPPRALLGRLGVRLRELEEAAPDREPVGADALERFVLGDELLQRLLHREPLRPEVELRRGHLPVLVGGEVLLEDVERSVQEIHEAVQQLLLGSGGDEDGSAREAPESVAPELQSVEIELPVGPSVVDAELLAGDVVLSDLLQQCQGQVVLRGSLSGVHRRSPPGDAGSLRLLSSFGQEKLSRRIALTLEHWALCASDHGATTSYLVTRGTPGDPPSVLRLAPVAREAARAHLSRWVTLMLVGMRCPLPLFGEASESFFHSVTRARRQAAKSGSDALSSGQIVHLLSGLTGALAKEPAVGELFRGRDPLLPWTPIDEANDAVFTRPLWRLAEWMMAELSEAEGSASAIGDEA